ncbi:PEP-CTERM sorting domain-containing protein [Crocosphaera chwakensis]|uniref:PEP-CTERM protein-sorting domain-containing protein n=1 Tax=Crocosphaera chwakensis CCY0110 TaxID=391612 RepID=A3INL2_9CHRO|nr:PEP-CTERM sorting domain-containing protein [Crocosphaera chwakensis]EAZ91910.1 hypothetical protein CY0110_29584 [Crocosphaera chwakensis CCY0110]
MKKVLSTLVGASVLATASIGFHALSAEAASFNCPPGSTDPTSDPMCLDGFSGNDTGDNGTGVSNLESILGGIWVVEGKSDKGFGSFLSGGNDTLSGTFSTGLTGAGAFSVKASTGYLLYKTSDISEFDWSTLGILNNGGNQPGLSHLTIYKPVPEPLTILGAGAAISFGTAFKRKLGKANKSNEKA